VGIVECWTYSRARSGVGVVYIGVARSERIMSDQISPDRTRPDANSPGKTIPRTYGVWDIGFGSSGGRYRYCNNPVRGTELARDYGRAKLMALYRNRAAAKSHADSLN
jgi:hypothetical protein